MSIHTKYIGERSNIVLQTRTFVLPPTYVDNHSYALVEVEKRGAAKEVTVCLPPNLFLLGVRFASANKSQISKPMSNSKILPILLKPKNSFNKLPILLKRKKQLEETGNTSEKIERWSYRKPYSKENIEDDLQSTTFLHQFLTEKHEFISKKKIGCEKESSTASNTNVTNLNKKFGPAQIVDTVRMQLFDVNRDCT
ncbi:hypothetical protein TNCV_761861 [Trichonephila clavipes]|nr:hypothetical protein TNCV_761861 [Trichonephila clavipes]